MVWPWSRATGLVRQCVLHSQQHSTRTSLLCSCMVRLMASLPRTFAKSTPGVARSTMSSDLSSRFSSYDSHFSILRVFVVSTFTRRGLGRATRIASSSLIPPPNGSEVPSLLRSCGLLRGYRCRCTFPSPIPNGYRNTMVRQRECVDHFTVEVNNVRRFLKTQTYSCSKIEPNYRKMSLLFCSIVKFTISALAAECE